MPKQEVVLVDVVEVGEDGVTIQVYPRFPMLTVPTLDSELDLYRWEATGEISGVGRIEGEKSLGTFKVLAVRKVVNQMSDRITEWHRVLVERIKRVW